ncbi:MAG: methyl-accepting chemotaxis protein, partial [Spirochaetota bacterium]
ADQAKVGEDSLTSMNRSMDLVVKSSADMIGIVGIINDISDRINLLSLNASIEAARAGEAGKGFAVVAEEISKLADQTADSTKNIGSLITANSREIAQEIESLNTTTSILRQIITGVEEMRNEIGAIQMSTTEQSASSEKVRVNAGNIFSRAEEIKSSADLQKKEVDHFAVSVGAFGDFAKMVTGGAEEIAGSSKDIADTAKKLKSRVSVFKS